MSDELKISLKEDPWGNKYMAVDDKPVKELTIQLPPEMNATTTVVGGDTSGGESYSDTVISTLSMDANALNNTISNTVTRVAPNIPLLDGTDLHTVIPNCSYPSPDFQALVKQSNEINGAVDLVGAIDSEAKQRLVNEIFSAVADRARHDLQSYVTQALRQLLSTEAGIEEFRKNLWDAGYNLVPRADDIEEEL